MLVLSFEPILLLCLDASLFVWYILRRPSMAISLSAPQGMHPTMTRKYYISIMLEEGEDKALNGFPKREL
jgi:hypothetical protein